MSGSYTPGDTSLGPTMIGKSLGVENKVGLMHHVMSAIHESVLVLQKVYSDHKEAFPQVPKRRFGSPGCSTLLLRSIWTAFFDRCVIKLPTGEYVSPQYGGSWTLESSSLVRPFCFLKRFSQLGCSATFVVLSTPASTQLHATALCQSAQEHPTSVCALCQRNQCRTLALTILDLCSVPAIAIAKMRNIDCATPSAAHGSAMSLGMSIVLDYHGTQFLQPHCPCPLRLRLRNFNCLRTRTLATVRLQAMSANDCNCKSRSGQTQPDHNLQRWSSLATPHSRRCRSHIVSKNCGCLKHKRHTVAQTRQLHRARSGDGGMLCK